MSLSARHLLVAVLVLAKPSAARAQACCAAPSLATPARLGRDERAGVGLLLRGRDAYGAFAADGAFATTATGDVETAQELFVAARPFARAQVAVAVPFVQTRRRAPGLSDWGGGLGDVRASAHVELLRAGERRFVPGVALLAGLALPTGTPPDAASGALAADATGTGSFEGSLGVELDQRFERIFATLAGTVGRRSARAIGAVRQSFGVRLAALASGGVTLANEASVGVFLAGSHQGAAHDADALVIDGSALALVTAGLGATSPIGAGWRAQASASFDCPVAGLGRNQPTSVGLGLSLLRVWP
jgi:hypothetical protein